MPIERAKMKLKVTAPARDTKKVMEKMKQLNCQIEEESHDPDLILVSILYSETSLKSPSNNGHHTLFIKDNFCGPYVLPIQFYL